MFENIFQTSTSGVRALSRVAVAEAPPRGAGDERRAEVDAAGHAHPEHSRLQVAIVAGGLLALVGVGAMVAAAAGGASAALNTPGFLIAALASTLFFLSATQGMLCLSALMRVGHATFRYPIQRMLDSASLFGLSGVLVIPLLAVLRAHIYAIGTAPDDTKVWRIQGAMWWDCLFVGTCYLAGFALWYLSSIPDWAILAERADLPAAARARYRRLAGRFVGAQQQWKRLRLAEGSIAVAMLPLFVGSQTALGWDFQLATSKNWDASIFAPHVALSALLSGVAMAVLLMTVLNAAHPGEKLIQERHYDSLGRLMLALGVIWFYFRWCDYITNWFGHIPDEWVVQNSRTVAFPAAAGIMVLCCVAVPVFGNMIHRIRVTVGGLCTVSSLVLVGVFLQRYIDEVPSFVLKYPLDTMVPSGMALLLAVLVFLALGGLLALTYSAAATLFPMVSIWARASERARTKTRKLGNADVTVMVEDPPVWGT